MIFRKNLLSDSATLLTVANEFLPVFSRFLCLFWLTSGTGNLHSMMLSPFAFRSNRYSERYTLHKGINGILSIFSLHLSSELDKPV